MLSLKSLSALLAVTLQFWEAAEKSSSKPMKSEETGWLHRHANFVKGEATLRFKIFTWWSSCPAYLASFLFTTTSKHWCRFTNTRQMVKEKQLNESREEVAEILNLINCCKILVCDTQIHQNVIIKAALTDFLATWGQQNHLKTKQWHIITFQELLWWMCSQKMP